MWYGLFVYGHENFNGPQAYRRYLKIYLNRRNPFNTPKNFYGILIETGSFCFKRDSAGNPKTTSPEDEEEILVRIAENPELNL